MAKESVEALLHPSLKVSRPVAACTRCRSAKIKCTFDGKRAACSSCERAGKSKECSSANDEFARGKERSYSSALETTIQKLQKKIHDAHARPRQDSMVMFSTTRPPLQRRPISNSRRKEAGSMDELVSNFGFLTVNATSRDFQGFNETMSFSKMLTTISSKEQLPEFSDTNLPPRYSVSHLINHYFENVHVLLPFFSETDFMSSLSRIYQDSATLASASAFDMWSLRLVLAISSAQLSQTRGDENHTFSLQNISAAMKIAEQVVHPGSITGIQALLFWVQYAQVDPWYFDSWYLIGMASRLAVDLGLHCEPALETKISKQALDLRRRLFYCTYALDRLIAMSLGYTFSFTDDSAPNVLLPTLAVDQEARSPTQVFIRSVRPSLFLFDLRRVQSSFYQKTRCSSRRPWDAESGNAYINSTLDDVQAWHATLPSHFSPRHLKLFHLESLYSQCLALAPNEVIPMPTVSNTHKRKLFNCLIEYSDLLCSMVQNTDIRTCLCYADFCRARFAARQFQSLLWAQFDLIIRDDPDEDNRGIASSPFERCTKALRFISNLMQVFEWPGQRWGITTLKDLFQRESAVLLARLQTRQQEYSLVDAASMMHHPTFDNSYHPYSEHSGFQQPHLPSPHQLNIPPIQSYDQASHAYTAYPSEATAMYSDPAMHRANLLRATSWSPQMDTPSSDLPQGSLPRRSYQFQGPHG